MSNAVYPTGLAAFAAAGINWTSDAIKVVLLEGYTYSSAHQFYSDLSTHPVGTPAALSGKSVSGGDLKASPATISSVVTGHTVTAYAIFKDTGSSATSPLIAFMDTKSDTTAISVTTDGGNVVIDWSTATVANRVVKI